MLSITALFSGISLPFFLASLDLDSKVRAEPEEVLALSHLLDKDSAHLSRFPGRRW